MRVSGLLLLQQRKQVEIVRHSQNVIRPAFLEVVTIFVRFAAVIFGALYSASSQKENKSPKTLLLPKKLYFSYCIQLFYVAGVRLTGQIILKGVKSNTFPSTSDQLVSEAVDFLSIWRSLKTT